MPKEAFAELSHWFGNASLLLNEVKAAEPGASDIVTWPHHFDTATLITLSGKGESARTIGVGLSPATEATRNPIGTSLRGPPPSGATCPN